MIFDLFGLALNNIFHKKKRSILTIIGIFIGIMAVVSLVSLGQGLSVSINDQFSKIGKDKLILVPGANVGPTAAFTSSVLTDLDLNAVKKISGVNEAAPAIVKSTLVGFGSESKETFIIGIPVDRSKKIAEEMYAVDIKDGRLFESYDKYRCIIGETLSKDNKIFKKGVKIGNTLKINGNTCKVVGITKSSGDPFSDQGVFMPIQTVKDIFKVNNYYRIILRVNTGIVPKDLVDPITAKLRNVRGVQKGKEDFNVVTSDQIVNTFNSIFGIVQAVVIGIAAISLLVGGIGIMNTMYTAVLERTREIGIMKAIGARNSDITLLFLIESGILGLVGGLVGLAGGFMLSKGVELFAVSVLQSNLLQAYFPIELVLGSLAFSFVVGIISGAFPAAQAANLTPIDSLRYE